MSLSKKAAQEAMIARQKAEVARPKTGKPGPEMPVMGRLPAPSSKKKAEQQKKLDAKIKANQPALKPALGVLPSKPANAPMEQVEIDKANKITAIPQTKMPQANTVPNAQMAAMQKMPQPNTAPPSNMSVVPNLKGTGFSVGPNGMPQLGGSSNMMSSSPAGGVPAMKRGGSVRSKPAAKFSSGGSTKKTLSRGDGIAQRGKTKGRYI